MIKFEKNAHWYDCSNGEGKTQHDATLREARKQNLYPSVTTVDKEEFPNEFLTQWKMNEMANSAYDNPPMAHEEKEAYVNRLYELSGHKAATAADFGKELHAAIDDYPQLSLDDQLKPWIEEFGNWYDDFIVMPHAKEKIVWDDDLGVAGTMDFSGCSRDHGDIIIDWKSQRLKEDKNGKVKPNFYPGWCRQLSFYGVCEAKKANTYPKSMPTIASVVIDSNKPRPPIVKIWSQEEVRFHYEEFVTAAVHYFRRKDFWPHRFDKPRTTISLAIPYE